MHGSLRTEQGEFSLSQNGRRHAEICNKERSIDMLITRAEYIQSPEMVMDSILMGCTGQSLSVLT
jgi:hypothetical protein